MSARSSLRPILTAAAIGAAIGVWMVRHGKPVSSPALVMSPMAISAILWIVLSIYWEWAARNRSEAQSAEPRLSRLFHLTLVNAALVLSFWPFAGWPTLATPRFEFPRVLPETKYLAALGLAIAIASLWLALWAQHHLGRNWSGAVTVKVDHELVRTGPYRWIRHPIYTGAIGMYAGTALISGRLQGPLSLLLISLAYARKIRQEERALSGVFGPAYDEYRRESWAVFPWIV